MPNQVIRHWHLIHSCESLSWKEGGRGVSFPPPAPSAWGLTWSVCPLSPCSALEHSGSEEPEAHLILPPSRKKALQGSQSTRFSRTPLTSWEGTPHPAPRCPPWLACWHGKKWVCFPEPNTFLCRSDQPLQPQSQRDQDKVMMA